MVRQYNDVTILLFASNHLDHGWWCTWDRGDWLWI